MMARTRAAATATGLIIVLAHSLAAEAAEIRIIAGGALSAVIGQLGPSFERTTGHKIVAQYGASGALKRRIEADEPFDLAILPQTMIDDLIKQGKIAGDTRTEIARVGLVVGVRAGAPRPDVSSIDAFKNTLLGAKSITYAPEGATGIHLVKVFTRLGITEQMKAKTILHPVAARAAQAVANGEVELVFAAAPNLLSVRGVEIAGMFPPDLQDWVIATAGIATNAKETAAAKALITHLRTPEAATAIRANGWEPIPAR